MARNSSSRRKYSRGGGGHGWPSLFGTLTNTERAFVEQRARELRAFTNFGLLSQEEALEQIGSDLESWREEHQRISRWRNSAHRRGGRK